ncbi:hypothetical protein BGY98DRAFT_264291 [Russula aff. rugulosa BPL654]|nr:hypothetical protein BGY98DRAFT_264291 [Russula aff. rugulosa BPL654]
MAENLAHPYNRRTIDVLPDEVLLAIFDFYVVPYQDVDLFDAVVGEQDAVKRIESWQSLVHVCRRWRGLVFGSPRRLNLQLYYDSERSATKTLDVWPPCLSSFRDMFPKRRWIVSSLNSSTAIAFVKSVSAATQLRKLTNFGRQCRCHSRSSQICTFHLEAFPMCQFFPIHSWVDLPHAYDTSPWIPFHFRHYQNYFCLPRTSSILSLRYSSFRVLFTEAMATCLFVLTSLESLRLEFESPQSSPDQENRRSPPRTLPVLPALSFFSFKGVNEYLEELVARVDTPRLYQFRSSTLRAPNKAHVFFDSQTAWIKLQPQASNEEYFEICATSSPLFFTTENLFISEGYDAPLDWKGGIENIEWLELLLPFTAVKNLYLSKQFAPRIAPVLQEMTVGGTTEVLSTLQNLYLEGFQPSESVEEGIERFISARQLADHPVAVSVWDRDLV